MKRLNLILLLVFFYPPAATTTAAVSTTWRTKLHEFRTLLKKTKTSSSVQLELGDSSFLLERPKVARGIFLAKARHAQPRPIYIQIPHRFYDRGTAEIGLLLCAQLRAALCSWNNVHRKKFDLAHAGAPTKMDTVMLEFLKANKHATIVQIHGFSASKRRSNSARIADAIVSVTSANKNLTPKHLQKITATNLNMKLFGTEVFELGGLTNGQRRQFVEHSHGRQTFVHVELSESLRKTIINSTDVHQLAQPLLGIHNAR